MGADVFISCISTGCGRAIRQRPRRRMVRKLGVPTQWLKKNKTSDALIKDALEEFEDSEEASSTNRTHYAEDTAFARGSDQWPAAVRKQRVQEARPVLTINKLPALIRSVVNESKQNKPAIEVSPVDNGADVDTAEIINGIIRSVERNSNAGVAYGTAVDQAVTGGFGFFRIDIDYAHQNSFDLQAQIKRIPNALSVPLGHGFK